MRVFLGGTCNGSLWKQHLITLLEKEGIEYFDPAMEDWNEVAQKNELREREVCDVCLYTITPETVGCYPVAEVVDDSNKSPDKTILALIESKKRSFYFEQGQSLQAVARLVEKNGVTVVRSFEAILKALQGIK